MLPWLFGSLAMAGLNRVVSMGRGPAELFFKDHVRPVEGSVLSCHLAGFWDHTGIYVGDGKIVHRDGDGYISEVTPSEFLARLGGYNPAISPTFHVRVYTKGVELGAVYGPTLALLAVHRIWTMNPDYEVIRYPRSIEVRYMHVDIHDASDDQGIADAFKEEVASATNQVSRVANEAWDCVGDAFNTVKGWFS